MDDEPAVAFSLARFLERKGFRVTIARNAVEALDAFEADPADVLITDMRMPFMGGAELAMQLRRLNPHLPLLVCTGHSDDLDTVQALGGSVEVFMKPYDPMRLLDSLNRLTATASAA